ncbi:sensor histidine kinase [Methylocystis parvus]|uniref:sensor histidine kinase n=1 Tax=Methylocystis parvus TaxID=134 RepID=UPI003C744DC9
MRRSLSFRLVVCLAVAQFLAIVFLVPFIEFFVSVSGLTKNSPIAPDAWGAYRMRALVVDSIKQMPGGDVIIEPTAALRHYVRENIQARYAVFDVAARRALSGSSPELVTALNCLDHIDAFSIKFHLADDPDMRSQGNLTLVQTPFGNYAVAIYGYRFSWADLSEAAKVFLSLHTALVIAPGILGAALLAWLVVHHGLMPLRVAADDIASIDVDSLDRRLSADGAPREIAPFIEAVNRGLETLDKGVTAQRRFAANVAHELRTPIAIMRAHADNPDDQTFRRDMRRDIRRMQTIVEQLLASTNPLVRSRSAPGEIDLGATVLALVADYTPLIVENGRRIEFEAPKQPIRAKVDKWALECVVSNLLDNALRAEPEGGVIVIHVSNGAVVEVIDHGSGIPAEDRDRIFEPFWRRDTRGRGAGIGLAISKSLTEVMGGSLFGFDTAGGGATFRLVLRQAEPAMDEDRAASLGACNEH